MFIITYFLVDDVIILEINLSFLIKPFFLHDQKREDKNLNILRKNAVKVK